MNEEALTWVKDTELILKEWSDKSVCYKWLHLKSHEKYVKKNTIFIIPVIVISTLSGVLNFTQNQIPIEYVNYYVLFIGGLNILNGMLSTIHQYLKIAELGESHKIAYISWDKLYNNIKTELSKNIKNRIPLGDFIMYCKQEYNRLLEISPIINDDILLLFHTTFEKDENLIVPDVLGKIKSTGIYESTVPTELNDTIIEIDKLKKKTQELERTTKIENIKIDFLQRRGRLPTDEELENVL